MKKAIYLLLLVYAVIALLTIIFFTGTGGAGDSVYHYLYAKYAPLHPALFFNHWAKPVFVLLACPFAQAGFNGIKVFNVLVTLVTMFFTFKAAEGLKLQNPLMSVVLMMFAPLYYILAFSGLTEPLFALVIALVIYCSVRQQYVAATLIISFLPFVRSEGLIIIGVFVVYLVFRARFKLIPLLLAGTVIYSLAGFFVHHDFFWVFDKIPYAKLSSPYGSGSLFHFVDQLLYVVGIPVYILFWAGVISIIRRAVKKIFLPEEQILVFLGFFAFFIAHSLFWYFGIFNSMGLKRVLIGVMPMISLISLQGFNFLTEEIIARKQTLKKIIQWLLVAYVVIFPFTSNKAAINWKKDMMLGTDQLSAIQASEFIRKKEGPFSRILCSNPYVWEVMDIDCFDPSKRIELTPANISLMKPGDLVIWDNWFAVVESGMRKEDLDQNPALVNLYSSNVTDGDRVVMYSVFGVRGGP